MTSPTTAVSTDTGLFQVNDIVLDPPPRKISIQRQSFNYKWNTLRNRNAIKVKSGYSVIDIQIQVTFVGYEGFDKLRELIAQVRVTPFCYVENQFLRNTIIEGNRTETIVLAVKNASVRKSQDHINTIDLVLDCAYFNYKPYTSNWLYRTDIFGTIGTPDPRYSHAWKLLTSAELRRGGGKYKAISHKGQSPEILSQELGLGFREFISPIATKATGDGQELMTPEETVKAYFDLQRKIADEAEKKVQSGAASEFQSPVAPTPDLISQTSQLLGNTTSMALELFSEIETTSGSKKYVYRGVDWEPLYQDGKIVTKNGRAIFSRQSLFSAERTGLSVTGVDIAFRHTLAIIPLTSQSIATYQHIGSAEAVVSIQMLTTSETPLQIVSHFYNAVEQAEVDFKEIPAGARALYVKNEIVNLCGISECITEQMFVETIPGQPGTYSMTLVLSEGSYAKPAEEFVAEFAFSSDWLRAEIAKVLVKNLRESFNYDVHATGRRGEAVESVVEDLSSLRYVPKTLKDDEANKKFYDFTAKYGKMLTSFAKDLGTILGTDPQEGEVFAAMTLDDEDLPGLGMAQEWVSKFMLHPQRLRGLQNNLGNTGGAFSFSQGLSEMGTHVATPEPVEEHRVFAMLERRNGLFAQAILIQDKSSSIENPELNQLTLEIERLDSQIESALKADVGNRRVSDQEEYSRMLREDRIRTDVMAKASPADLVKLRAIDEVEDGKRYLAMKRMEREGLTGGAHRLLQKYRGQYAKLIDELINPGAVLELEQFRDLARKVQESLLRNEGGTAYPDFPLKEVIEELRGMDDGFNAELSEFLFKEWRNSGSYMKGLGPSVLVGPDFYLINETTDGPGELTEEAAKAKILKTSQESLDSYVTAHSSILGKIEAGHIGRTLALQEKSDQSVAELLKADEKGVLFGGGQSGMIKAQMVEQSQSFMPFDFPEGTVCLPVASALLAEGADPVEFSEMGIDDASVGDSDFDQITDRSWTSYPRKQCILSAGNVHPDEQIIHLLGGKQILDQAGGTMWGNESGLRSTSLGAPRRWIWPIPLGYVVTGPFHAEKKVRHGSPDPRPHWGIDLAYNKKQTTTAGKPVWAAAPGRVISASSGRRGGNIVVVQHGGGWFSKYMHLQSDEAFETAKGLVRTGKKIRAGDQIGSIGNTGIGSAAHLHFETLFGGKTASKHAIDPAIVMTNIFAPAMPAMPVIADSPAAEGLLDKHMGTFHAEMQSGQGKGLARAYPTFKLYFIESDFGERREFAFDDFFSYASVKEIQLIQTKDNPAHVCVFEVTNISGILSNRKFRNAIDKETQTIGAITRPMGQEDVGKPLNRNTAKENPLVSLMLKPGIQVQLRLGYVNNPSLLDIVFNGAVTEVQFSESDDLVRVVAQSYGMQLVQRLKGIQGSKNFGGWFSQYGNTGPLLEELMGSSELTHFGRWEPGSSGQGNMHDTLTDRFQFTDKPRDQNVFAPGGGSCFNPFKGSPKYKLFRTTIWDVFQEMTLRHPGFIAYPREYEGEFGPRMTMFFGVPNQLYTARDPSPHENEFSAVLQKLQEKVEEGDGLDELSGRIVDKLKDAGADVDAGKFEKYISDLKQGNEEQITRARFFKQVKTLLSRKLGHTRPFQSYHLATSDSHIISNNISNDVSKTLNAINLEYGGSTSAWQMYTDALTGDFSSLTDSPSANVVAGRLESPNPDIFSMKADVDLPDEEVREFHAHYPNCLGEEQARRYALSLLWRALQKSYKGSIVLMGNPSIRPYDIVFLADTYSDMIGPIEVEQVVHKFSDANGFVTEVKPGMVTHINQSATMTTHEYMGMIAAEVANTIGFDSAAELVTRGIAFNQVLRNRGKEGGADIAAVVGGNLAKDALGKFASLAIDSASFLIPGFAAARGALWLMSKQIAHTQLNHPMRFEPLVYRGNPMVRGLQTKYNEGGLLWQSGKFVDEGVAGIGKAIRDTYEQYWPGNWFETRGDFKGYVFNVNQGYTGPVLKE